MHRQASTSDDMGTDPAHLPTPVTLLPAVELAGYQRHRCSLDRHERHGPGAEATKTRADESGKALAPINSRLSRHIDNVII